MYTLTEALFVSDFDALPRGDQKIISMLIRKISNKQGLKKGDFKDHILTKGPFKGCHDCHPFVNSGNDHYVLIYEIKRSKLIFKRVNTHKILKLSEIK
ncbi:hypothetical protein FACS1894166_05850 [Bacilli bacterium]|nr:hypothetical protein FACS1894166_05850 [Bacilli bacterium]